MMMGRVLKAMAPFLLLISARLQGQEQNTFAYVESFRKSSTRIRDSTYAADPDPKNQTRAHRAQERNSGRERYQFNCVPEHPSPGDSRIVGWQIWLADLSHRIYPNVLMPSA